MKSGRVFDVESLVDFRLPFLLERVEIVKDLFVGSAAVEMGDKDRGMPQIRTDLDSGDGEEHALQSAFAADKAGEDTAD